MIIDSHFHTLSMAKRGISELPDGLVGIDVGTDPGDAEERLSLLPPSPSVFFSIGSGPWRLSDCGYGGTQREEELLRRDISRHGADAIGECGFDNHWKYGDRKSAMELFMMQAALAEELGVPIIIHTRDADDEIREAISSPSFRCRGIMHCYSSGPLLMRIALDKGLFISFSGNVTYKGSDIIRESAKAVPRDRILYETDSPYLAPIPMRGKPCRPEYTEYTLSFLAELRGEDREELKGNVLENLYSVLGREESVRKGIGS